MTASRFKDEVVVVTGARQGIGRACAARFAAEGASVALLDVHPEVHEVARELESGDADAKGWVVDVADASSLQRCANEVIIDFGGVDVLHSHAGIWRSASAIEETNDSWERLFAVNVRGMFLTVKTFLPAIRSRGGGAIVLTGSMSGIIAEQESLAYCTSKAAVNHMAKQLALDYARDQIRVNAICPGWVDTAFAADFISSLTETELNDALRTQIPLGRQGSADEIAAAVAFLASDEASYITGHQLVIDGGYTIQ